jgi:FMN-dependent NADH-azoreductase
VRPANAPQGAIGVPDDKGAGALDEFVAADAVVIGAPMYNFTIPSQLKAWIDRILIAGKTFRYSEAGPVGLAGGKRVIIASSRGGLYAPGMPFEANDFQEPYLRAVLAFIGIEDIEIVRAEGLALGRDAAVRAALASVPSAFASFATRLAAKGLRRTAVKRKRSMS